MALLHRINQSKLRKLSHCFRRGYFQVLHGPVPPSTNPTSVVSSKRKVFSVVGWKDTAFCDNVRFFAAPIQFQVKPKEEKEDSSGPRLNEQITAREVRLVTEEGVHFIVPFREALDRAKKEEKDLVEVDRNANPPVCKIADFHKERYERLLKEKERAKAKAGKALRKGGECKEVRFSTKTELKDLNFKADGIKRLMDRGYRVKCLALGTDNQDLTGFLSKMLKLIEDVCVVESGPHVDKKGAYAIVRHIKYGLPKKSGKIKVAKKDKAAQSNEDVTEETEESVVSDEEEEDEESIVFDERPHSPRQAPVQPPPPPPPSPTLSNRYQRTNPNPNPRSNDRGGPRENRYGAPQGPNQRGPVPPDVRASFPRNMPGPSNQGGPIENRYGAPQGPNQRGPVPPDARASFSRNSPGPNNGHFSNPRSGGR